MDSNFIIFLITAAFLAAVFGVLYIMSKSYTPKKKRMQRLKELEKIKAVSNKSNA